MHMRIEKPQNYIMYFFKLSFSHFTSSSQIDVKKWHPQKLSTNFSVTIINLIKIQQTRTPGEHRNFLTCVFGVLSFKAKIFHKYFYQLSNNLSVLTISFASNFASLLANI